MSESSQQSGAQSAEALLSRRGFLKVGIAGTAVAALGGVSLALRQSLLREVPAAGLQVLSQKEYSVMAAIADVVCPARGEGAPGATKLDVALKADRTLATLHPSAQKEFKVLLGAFDSALLAFALDGRITPFTKLSFEDQTRALEQWGESGLLFRRTAFQALKALASALYYGDEATWKRGGYSGPPDVSLVREARAAERAERESALRGGRP